VDKDTRYTTAGVAALVVTVAGTAAVATLWGDSRTTDVVLWGIVAVGAVCGVIGVATRSYLVSVLAGALGLAVAILFLVMLGGGRVTRVSDLAFLGIIWSLLGVRWLAGFVVTVLVGFLVVDLGAGEHATRPPSA